MFSVYSLSIYRCSETGLIKLRISSDTQFINNIKIYQFYPCYNKTTISIPIRYQWVYKLKFENFKVEYFHCILCIDDFKILKMFIKLSKRQTTTPHAPTCI